MDRRALRLAALQTGVARNHQEFQPTVGSRVTPLLPITDIREPFVFSTVDDDLPVEPDAVFLGEKLVLDKETAEFLQLIARLGADRTVSEANLFLQGVGPVRRLRLETPLTRANSEPRFSSQLISDRLKKEKFERMKVDEEADGGVCWSQSTKNDVAMFEKSMVHAEKLDMDATILQLIGDAANPKFLSHDELFPPREKTSFQEPLTPPLLPLSESRLRLRPLPDLSGLLQPVDAGTSEDLIAEITWPYIAADGELGPCAPSSSPSRFLQTETPVPSPVRKRLRPDELKVEAPLTPLLSTAKKVRFSSVLASDVGSFKPWILESETLNKGAFQPANESDFMEDIARPIAVHLGQELAQEQLQQADSTMRVPVPVIDQSLPTPPWESMEKALEKFHDIRSWAGDTAKQWRGISSIELQLPWRVFPRELTVAPIESIEEPGIVETFLITDVEAERQEKELLECMRELQMDGNRSDEEEELLEPMVFKEKEDICIKDMLKKRKMEKDKRQGSRHKSTPTKKGVKSTTGGISDKNASEFRSAFFASSSLDAFMKLRGRAVKPANTTLRPSKIISGIGKLAPKANRDTSHKPGPAVLPSVPDVPPIVAARPPFPVPEIRLPQVPGTFIVSTTLLSQRSLFKHISELYPTARMIERDFAFPIPSGNTDIFGPSGMKAPDNTTSAGGSESKSVDEADLILSATTGLVFVTLQKLGQRDLPGQAGSFSSGSSTKERIVNLCQRYECLVVVVWNQHSSVADLCQNDADVIASLMAFGGALQDVCTVVSRMINGTEEDLARWVVALMVQQGKSVELLEDETLWELFLRDAGLNAFAAQAVLREVREYNGKRGGLPAFLAMDASVREDRFSAIVGNRVLRRVSRRLDGAWGIDC